MEIKLTICQLNLINLLKDSIKHIEFNLKKALKLFEMINTDKPNEIAPYENALREFNQNEALTNHNNQRRLFDVLIDCLNKKVGASQIKANLHKVEDAIRKEKERIWPQLDLRPAGKGEIASQKQEAEIPALIQINAEGQPKFQGLQDPAIDAEQKAVTDLISNFKYPTLSNKVNFEASNKDFKKSLDIVKERNVGIKYQNKFLESTTDLWLNKIAHSIEDIPKLTNAYESNSFIYYIRIDKSSNRWEIAKIPKNESSFTCLLIGIVNHLSVTDMSPFERAFVSGYEDKILLAAFQIKYKGGDSYIEVCAILENSQKVKPLAQVAIKSGDNLVGFTVKKNYCLLTISTPGSGHEVVLVSFHPHKEGVGKVSKKYSIGGSGFSLIGVDVLTRNKSEDEISFPILVWAFDKKAMVGYFKFDKDDNSLNVAIAGETPQLTGTAKAVDWEKTKDNIKFDPTKNEFSVSLALFTK